MVAWTEQAAADALSIHAYIAKQSEIYADAVYERFLARAERLQDHPRAGSLIPEFKRDDLREVFVHSFRVIYQILPDEV